MKNQGRTHMGEINCTIGMGDEVVVDCKSKDRGRQVID